MSNTPNAPGTPKIASSEQPNAPGTPKISLSDQPNAPGTPNAAGHRYVLRATGDEAKAYDFKTARPPRKTTNLIESISHLVKSALGGGVVSIHESYMKLGLLTALGLNVLLAIVVAYFMHILVKSAQRMYGRSQTHTMTYPDLAEATLATGPFEKLRKYDKCFRYLVDATITIDLFGSCCVYQVMIAKTIRQLYALQFNVKEEAYSLRFCIFLIWLPCILICMIRSLKYLAPFSIVADIFIVVITFTTVYFGSKQATKSPTDTQAFPLFKSFAGLFEFVGVCVFSMEAVGAALAVENSMTEPKHFKWVLLGGMPMIAGMVMLVGFFGYWGYGDKAQSPVTLNFPTGSAFPIALKYLMAMMIYVTYALNFWIPFELVWYYLKKRHPEDKHWIWERVYRAILITGLTLIAIAFPDVSSFIGLLGSFCLSNMGFIYPAFIQFCLDYDEYGLGCAKWRLLRLLAWLFFGVVLCVGGTYFNVINLIKSSMGNN